MLFISLHSKHFLSNISLPYSEKGWSKDLRIEIASESPQTASTHLGVVVNKDFQAEGGRDITYRQASAMLSITTL